MNTESKSNDAFFGGRSLTVLMVDGSQQAIKVRQLLLGQYEEAIPLLRDEIALTSFCCVMMEDSSKPLDKSWALKLQPESYELIHGVVKEVNAKGFFSYAARHQARERDENESWLRASADLPPEVLRTAMDLGATRLRNSSPKPR